MICPKCQNVMQTVDRMGIHIDQCQSCRGIFLDRGELEQIVGAEQRYNTPAAPPPYQGDPAYRGRADSPQPYRGGYGDSPPAYGQRGGYRDSPSGYGGHGGHGGHGRRKKRGFLEELFD